jgi:hypothetical protein
VTSADAALEQLHQSLIDTGIINYLYNPVRWPNLTCDKCAGFREGYQRCYKCEFEYGGAADLVGSMIFAGDDLQSGKLMYGYKSAAPGPSHVRTVKTLVSLALRGHISCAGTLVGLTTTHWATVPSLRHIGSQHPFREILKTILPADREIVVSATEAAAIAQDRRRFEPAFYALGTPVPKDTHVMVIDDTYTSGAHSQSVSLKLKQAGASKVSVLTVARWLDMEKGPVRQFFRDRVRDNHFDAYACPWTGGDCPSSG